ncbi:MAG: cytochrome c family protein [Telmatospirillum sp.]|nr:cytochrome c family protein [Telmatospirillum sp.]
MKGLAAAFGVAVVGLALMGVSQAQAADAAAGEGVFKRVCSVCHNPTAEGPRKLGPTLAGVVGRKSGSVEGFRYSKANAESGIVWTPDKLDPYIKNPREVVPGTAMAYAGLRNDDERANLIAYLATLK